MIIIKAGTVLLDLQSKKIGLAYEKNSDICDFPNGYLKSNESLLECATNRTEEKTGRINHLFITEEIGLLEYINSFQEKIELYMYLAVDDGPAPRNINFSDEEILKWASADEVESLLSYHNSQEFWTKIKAPIKSILTDDRNLASAIISLTDFSENPIPYYSPQSE